MLTVRNPLPPRNIELLLENDTIPDVENCKKDFKLNYLGKVLRKKDPFKTRF